MDHPGGRARSEPRAAMLAEAQTPPRAAVAGKAGLELPDGTPAGALCGVELRGLVLSPRPGSRQRARTPGPGSASPWAPGTPTARPSTSYGAGRSLSPASAGGSVRIEGEQYRTNPMTLPKKLLRGPRNLRTTGCKSEVYCLDWGVPKTLDFSKAESQKQSKGGMPKPPQTMHFQSWWVENGEKNHIDIYYFPALKKFKLQPGLELLVAVNNRYGDPLEPWDLHVGACINILDRRVTLRRADCTVVNWLDYHAHRLQQVKLKLEDELSKFCFVQLTKTRHVSSHNPDHIWSHNPHRPSGGRLNLRGFLREIDYLQEQLARYKPRHQRIQYAFL